MFGVRPLGSLSANIGLVDLVTLNTRTGEETTKVSKQGLEHMQAFYNGSLSSLGQVGGADGEVSQRRTV